jgi:hypothetical protein
VSIANGGTAATTAGDALTNLGSGGFRYVEVVQTTNVPVTMNTGVTPNTLTITATGPLSIDSYSLLVGDIVLFTNQSGAGAQNGPWVVTNPGSAGVQPVLQRPSWFSGTAKPFTAIIRNGVSRFFSGYSVVGAASGDISVGTTVVSSYQIFARTAANASLGSNTFGNTQTFAANTTTVAPIRFSTPSALLTTTVAHTLEWDGMLEYLTALMTFSGTWASGNTLVTLTAGTTSGLVVGAAIASGITGTTLTIASITGLTTFTLSSNATNSGTATSFTVANRDSVLTANAYGTY